MSWLATVIGWLCAWFGCLTIQIYKTKRLFLYLCEALFFTIWKKMLIFGVWDESAEENIWSWQAVGEWWKLPNEKFCSFCPYPNIIGQVRLKMLRWMAHGGTYGQWEMHIAHTGRMWCKQNFSWKTWREEATSGT